MKNILTIKLSKRTKLSYFQNFISHTFLDNLLLEKNIVDSLYFYEPLPIFHPLSDTESKQMFSFFHYTRIFLERVWFPFHIVYFSFLGREYKQ